MGVSQITSVAEFDKALSVADKLVVVDFFATWCGPCKMISPMVEKFSNEYTQADFYKVDVDQVPEAAQKNEVSAMPTFILFKNGNAVAKVVGANPAGVKQAIASNV
ncbi:probable Thioredoxin-1 [Zygosaccharomyces bailii]|uniref:Thioredoxin n=1 Tax=Zygosaccharomyces bailii (strain CLIB 213 / ATCC 58445 / CBS 680 / BCRC 21525 / NBRC 1098 / NCYC 1416 / NRRL Y-2227) TaxID=1333698 RepID=A0A8J2T9A7_ZYGB2|nr:ZYBA0S07-00892g1_1 [Zygosaccharomyces bailii CLIB 213]CDH10803.1 probable Thioredoxin-1 [Zygosaccharomyces bailii ISA1307]SJM83948.1 probable Thioredoxin-1 [Zygosaccharomyces bailii]